VLILVVSLVVLTVVVALVLLVLVVLILLIVVLLIVLLVVVALVIFLVHGISPHLFFLTSRMSRLSLYQMFLTYSVYVLEIS